MADEEYEEPAEEEQQYEEPAQEEQQYEEPAQEEQQYEEPAQEEQQYEEPAQEEQQYEAPVEEKNEYVGGGDVNVGIDKSNVGAYCEDLYSENPSFDYFTTKLKDPKLKTADLVVDKVGKGGLPALKAVMQQEAEYIVFFLLRVNTYDNEGSSRAKFVYGRFVGTKVKFMQKAKLTPNLGAIADKFPVKHISKDCDEEMKDWTAEKLAKEFLRIGGAHKPSKYDFGGGDVYDVSKK